MLSRDSSLLTLRGDSLGAIKSQSSAEEIFQNNTLRPILKLQNEVLLALFSTYIVQQKNVFHDLSTVKKLAYIDHAVQRDNSFRNVLKGIIIALFTSTELSEYTTNTSVLNKRMMALIAERLKSQIQLLEPQL